MIWVNGKKMWNIIIDGAAVTKMWYNGLFIWQLIRSCFGSGVWKSDRPWLGDDLWRNNNS